MRFLRELKREFLIGLALGMREALIGTEGLESD